VECWSGSESALLLGVWLGRGAAVPVPAADVAADSFSSLLSEVFVPFDAGFEFFEVGAVKNGLEG
jgi:hypothetical protein